MGQSAHSLRCSTDCIAGLCRRQADKEQDRTACVQHALLHEPIFSLLPEQTCCALHLAKDAEKHTSILQQTSQLLYTILLAQMQKLAE